MTDSLPEHPSLAELLRIYNAAPPDTQKAILSLITLNATERRRAYVLDLAGLVLGWLLVVMFLAAATFLTFTGHTVAGPFIGTVDVVAVTGIFVLRRHKPDSG